MGGPQTRPFLLYPAHLAAPPAPPVGAEAVHRLLRAWRAACNDGLAAPLSGADTPGDPDAYALVQSTAGGETRRHG
jgi:hypothetical protein